METLRLIIVLRISSGELTGWGVGACVYTVAMTLPKKRCLRLLLNTLGEKAYIL